MFFQGGLPLELIHDIRHLNSKMSEIKIMSHDLSKKERRGGGGGGGGGGRKQQVKTANAGNRGRICLLQATNYEGIVISKNDNARVRSDCCVVSGCNYHQLLAT